MVPLIGRTGRERWWMSLTAVLFSTATVAWMLVPGAQGFQSYFGIGETTLFGVFEVTPFALVFKLVFLAVALLVLVGSADYLKDMRETGEYYALLLVATVGMMVVASGRDLITIFLGLETSALASYVLVGYRKTVPTCQEASMKYFIIGSLSAGLTLYGISLIYAVAGTVDLYALANFVTTEGLDAPLLLGMGLLVAGFGFKVTGVPFHMWAPDVYEGAPDPVTAFLAGGSKKMGFAAFFKVFFVGLIAVKLQWDVVVGILAILTMTAGNLIALQQTKIKRLLAWSSIAQAGYILIAFPVGTSLAVTGAVFHIITHAVTTAGAFLIIAALSERGFGDEVDSYRGLARRQPLAALVLSVIMLSLAGVPPLAGFASKFVLFASAIEAGLDQANTWLILLAVAGVLNSALSLVYYARVVRAGYAEETAQPMPRVGVPWSVSTGMVLVLVASLAMGVWPAPFIELGRIAADSLLATVP